MGGLKDIKGVVFDYGGTIDSNGVHWFEVLWGAFDSLGFPVSKEEYKQAYIHGERTLALNPIIRPEHTFLDVLHFKFEIQFKWLVENKFLIPADYLPQILRISEKCYLFAKQSVDRARPLLQNIHKRYPLVLVSNFYGNVSSVLKDFCLFDCFDSIVESSVVGIRKPDPAIFALGVQRLGLQPSEVVVIGDSFSKDIYSASQIGCKTVWLRGAGWEEKVDVCVANTIITDFVQLKEVFDI
ncbi:MAG: HAD family hydrolase [Bacteroidales bacterium]|nr:HAD family hydrolase [Bacteroidales bacterium]